MNPPTPLPPEGLTRAQQDLFDMLPDVGVPLDARMSFEVFDKIVRMDREARMREAMGVNYQNTVGFDLDQLMKNATERVKRRDRRANDPSASKYGVAGTETPRPAHGRGTRKLSKRERQRRG